MRQSRFALLMPGLFAPLLNGCMAMGMHGMMHHEPSHQTHSLNPPVTAEMRAGEVSIVLEVPSLATGEEFSLSVKIHDLRSSVPLSGAQVFFLIQQSEHSSAGVPTHTPHESPERRAAEMAEKGTYQLKHVFAEPGIYKIVAEVWLSGGPEGASPLVVTETREVRHREQANHSPGIQSVGVLGGIGMALMMALMMGRVLF